LQSEWAMQYRLEILTMHLISSTVITIRTFSGSLTSAVFYLFTIFENSLQCKKIKFNSPNVILSVNFVISTTNIDRFWILGIHNNFYNNLFSPNRFLDFITYGGSIEIWNIVFSTKYRYTRFHVFFETFINSDNLLIRWICVDQVIDNSRKASRFNICWKEFENN